MIFARFIAVALFLQGAGPAFLIGVWRPGGWFLACLAGIYVFLAAGLWRGQRWASPLALALTLPQLLVISSSWLSWRFFVFVSRGFGVAFPDPFAGEVIFFPYHSLGASLNFAFGYNQPLLAEFASIRPHSFVLLNVLVIPLLVLLLVYLARELIAIEPNHALQRAEAGDGVSSAL